jgi:predicted HicB family RNase H-like nuclease
MRRSIKPVRSSLLNIRINEEERRLFERRARTLGLSLSSWARSALRQQVSIEVARETMHQGRVARGP